MKYHFSVTDRFSRLRGNIQGSLPWESLPTGFKKNKRNHAHPSKTIFQWLTGFQDSRIMFKDICPGGACQLGSKGTTENHAHPSKTISQWLTGFQDSGIMFKDLWPGGACRLGSKGTRENHEDQSKSIFQWLTRFYVCFVYDARRRYWYINLISFIAVICIYMPKIMSLGSFSNA